MNIIEQIDDKFRAKFASDYCEVVLTNGEWQQIKAELAKVREDAERYRWLRSGGKDLSGEIIIYGYSPQELDETIDSARALKDGE